MSWLILILLLVIWTIIGFAYSLISRLSDKEETWFGLIISAPIVVLALIWGLAKSWR